MIGGMWILGGALTGTLTRGPALAVGLGLVWVLAVENLTVLDAPSVTWVLAGYVAVFVVVSVSLVRRRDVT